MIKKKEHFFSLDKHEEKHPVTFQVQIWDNDIFTPDDFLGKFYYFCNCFFEVDNYVPILKLVPRISMVSSSKRVG